MNLLVYKPGAYQLVCLPSITISYSQLSYRLVFVVFVILLLGLL